MFIYCYVDKYGIKTPSEFAYDKDIKYLESKVENGEFRELVILKRVF